METVRHYEFSRRLAKEIVEAKGSLKVALRCDGGPQEANITIIVNDNSRQWLVSHNGGKTRSDSWNLVGWMCVALNILDFADPIQNVYEDVINNKKTGWVVLTITGSTPSKAEYRKTL